MEILTNKTIIEDLENKINYLNNDDNQLEQLYILHIMQTNYIYTHLDYNQKYRLLELIKYIYSKNNDLNLVDVIDAVLGYYQDALDNKIDRYNITKYIQDAKNIPVF